MQRRNEYATRDAVRKRHPRNSQIYGRISCARSRGCRWRLCSGEMQVFALFDTKQAGHLTRDDFLQIGRALKGLRWTEACNHEKCRSQQLLGGDDGCRFNKINTSKSGVLSETEFLDFFKCPPTA